ncbi:MAG TPA: cyclopropane-fatty-acyl-phospholipid synthase family protein [Microthrixaceae bacterium]|nr:cyclopropane-fatty-acyl-phospholipid synthase family protein [Microthrixaceae bacterium]
MTTTEPRPDLIETDDVERGVDPARWPDVARRPDRPLRAAIARRLFARAVDRLPLRVELVAEGVWWGGGGPGDPTMRLVRPEAVFDRLGDAGLIGLGEAYLAGELDAGDVDDDSDELVAVFEVFARHVHELAPRWMQPLRRLGVRRQRRDEVNTPAGSRRNVSRHYDLSNELFAAFLDRTMTYSSALFGPAVDLERGATWDDLAVAQVAKIDRLLDQCAVDEGTRVLEIGTGWGELALRAAARGATVHSVTLSEEQRELASRRILDAGFADRVEVELADYRDVAGSYDAVVSLEMVEAVGEEYWPTYYEVIGRVLAPGGRVGIQTISIAHDRLAATRHDYTWIHKYVFPGGLVPSVEAMISASDAAGLEIVDDLAFGRHYAETLRLWRERFVVNARGVPDLGDDPTFRRMWTFYLAYCEAGFRSGYLDVHQLTMTARRSVSRVSPVGTF